MNRLEPKEIFNKYLDRGILPAIGEFFVDNKQEQYMCGVTVAAMDVAPDLLIKIKEYKQSKKFNHINFRQDLEIFYTYLAGALQVEREYMRGFMDGFDCHQPENQAIIDLLMARWSVTPMRKIGIEDGLELAQMLFAHFGKIKNLMEIEVNG